ncbi:MAG: DNA topoisomerase I [Methanomassiliicoccales archaeon]|nr:DNA topoisomerase I [Methanomassiliicoccales archaeon]NYT14905.1 DNA topoisomerase I [Methanomassiliicoccales archaeon]
MSSLIISEKSNAAARIATILSNGKQRKQNVQGIPVFEFDRDGEDYSVVGLRGHIVHLDYPKEMRDWGKTDPKKLALTEPEKKVTAGRLITVLRDLAHYSNQIIMATDYDREGELIGLETVRMLGVDDKILRRAKFSALTKQEIEEAFSNLTVPDAKLADSAETRQLIDLAWGASLTRLISLASGQTGHNFLSVGRVQSPTLSLIVDKHIEIENFLPEPFWLIGAKFNKVRNFLGEHVNNPFRDRKVADAIMDKIENASQGTVSRFDVKEKDELPPPPFNTTMLLVEANKIGLPASKAMKVAEDLYTDGFISYPRTDNTVYPKSLSLKFILERLKESEFKKEAEEILSQDRIRASMGKVQTTDHPPIHPVAPATKKKLKGDRWTLYELITRRFLATVAPAAKAEVIDCEVDVEGEAFTSKGYRILKEGWRKYYPYWRVRENILPKLEKGENVEVLSLDVQERMTQPPSHYTQGTLIQQMERLGLGTKSTRHDIVQKLYDRKYVEGANLIPTASGIAVVKSLEKHARTITESKMTSTLEKDMERIAEGEITLEEVVKESQEMLLGVIEVMQEHKDEIGFEIRQALQEQRFVGKCPKCGGDLRVIRSRKGPFIGCSNYPECKNAFPLPRSAKLETTEERCDVCELPKLKVIRKGQPVSIQCIDPKCETNKDRGNLGKCPKCGGDLRILYSRSGKRFVGCSGYPDCDQTYPLFQRGTIVPRGEECDECGAPVIDVKNGKRMTRKCIDPACSKNNNENGKMDQ